MSLALEHDSPRSRPAAAPDVSLLSVVVPVFNEDESLEILYRELTDVLTNWGVAYELVFVNDGSTDGTQRVLDRLAGDPRVVALHLRRNFGQTAALMAGFDHSRGDVVVSLDGDLQNDPADIPQLVTKLLEGYDVVSGWRKQRHDKALTRVLPSRIANWLIGRVTGVRLHDFGCTLKAYRKETLDDVRLYGEMHRFVPVHAFLHGGSIAELVVNHRPRRFGRSKYGLIRVVKVLLDLILLKFLASYAAKPIYVFGGFGLVCLLASLLPIGAAFAFKFAPSAAWQKDFVETPLPVVAAVMVLAGCLAVLQGLLAEMLMRTYYESQDKRTYSLARGRPRT